MVYESDEEMNVVLGKLEDNAFIRQQSESLKNYKKTIKSLSRRFNL